MKENIAKVFVLAAMLVLALTGCNLIGTDPVKQADADIARIDAAYARVVAGYDGGDVTVAEVMGDFNVAYNEIAQMYYYYFGMDLPRDEVRLLAEEVLSARVRSEITAAKFDAEHSLSEEELAQLEADIQSAYDSYLVGALEVAEGKNDEAKRESARVLLHESGVDYASISDSLLIEAKQAAMEEMLRGEIGAIGEDDLQAAYNAKLAEQQALYTDGYSFEFDMSSGGTVVCWQPDGYRTVKHILLVPSDALGNAYADAVAGLESIRSDIAYLEEELFVANDDDLADGERMPREIQAEIDALQAEIPAREEAVRAAEQACLDAVKEKTDEIYARLANGEDFDALVAAFGEDPGMQSEPAMSRGYYVSAASQIWDANFRDAAMELDQVGAYTVEPVVSGSGVHIIQYAADVLGGVVELDMVRDALYDEALEAAQNAHCEEIVSKWVAAANPSYDAEGLEEAYGAGD